MNSDRIIRTLRCQSWERAKGELQSVLQTYWDEGLEPESKYTRMSKSVNDFINYVEDEGLAE